MKKIFALAVLFLAATNQNLWAGGPYSSVLGSDSYDSIPDLVPTPNQTGTPSNNVPDIKDDINLLTGDSFVNNEDADHLQHTSQDNLWQVNNGGGIIARNASAAIIAAISVSADYLNTIRIYDTANPGTKVDLFGGAFSGYGLIGDGSFANPFPAAELPFGDGTQFKWNYLSDGASILEYDSDPTNNGDAKDHMVTYHLAGLKDSSIYLQFGADDPELYTFVDPYLIAWEDLEFKNGTVGDEDYNDNVYIVDRAAPVAVPEPVSTVLFLTGGAAMAGNLIRRRRMTVKV